ncbi:MAG TPA: MTH938/NDUFAF3 family protein [Steroidobacteraceae bacterium]|nr:MTH938/NDUFAF3 family protein [Steroidobacteraceae bacterium]
MIRAYRPGEIQIDEEVFRDTVIVSASAIERVPEIKAGADWSDAAAAARIAERMRSLDPELVLIGTGSSQVFPPAQFRAQFLRANIGIEVMDSGAACRTFNVLVGERRRVVALVMT